MHSKKVSRRDFLRLSAGSGLGLLGSSALAGCVGATNAESAEGSFNFMTWADHFSAAQLEEMAKEHKIVANPALFSDNSEAFLKLQQVGGAQLDMVSGDALWVPAYYKEGLIEPMDLGDFQYSKDLYSDARSFDMWTVDGGYLAYPFGWSPVLIAYNPNFVTPEPDSWEVLWDPKFKGRIAMELQPFDVMAFMGKATGAAQPYNMTAEELEKAKQALKDLQPNILKYVEQNVEVVQLLASETIWLAPNYLGVEERVKDAGGPEMRSFMPKEGSVGWIDGEMIATDAANRGAARGWLNFAMKPEMIAQNFLDNGRPLLNEAAYKLLVEQGHQERADRYLFNRPDIAATMTLKGPAPKLEDYINAFNEAIAN